MEEAKGLIGAVVEMDRKDMLKYLRFLSDVLGERSVHGEIVLYGGAAMVLAFDARPQTRDVDAVYKPERVVYDAANEVVVRYGAPVGWLNDAVEVFRSGAEDLKFLMDFPNLKVYHAAPEYILAMKCMSMRLGRGDKDLFDIKFLIRSLAISSAEEVLAMVKRYYPKDEIPPKTKFAIEELLSTE